MHRLLGVTQKPRFVAYLLAFVVVASPAFGSGLNSAHLLLACSLILYTCVLHLVVVRVANSVKGTRCAMMIDGFVTGALVAAVNFHLVPGGVLLTMLVISTLIVAPPVWLVGLGFSVCLGAFTAIAFDLPQYWNHWNQQGEITALACLLAYACTVAYLVYRETSRLNSLQKNARWLGRSLDEFRNRVAPYLMSQVVRDQEHAQVLRRKRLTVMFSDICGFTRHMDQVDERLVAKLLNEYFEGMAQIARTYGGTVNKFMGDGLMVFIGDEDDRSSVEHAASAIAMALEMQAAVRRMSTRWRDVLNGELLVRIGIHTGYCLIGSLGSSDRRDYTILGSTVNLASRLESIALPGEVLISGASHDLVGAAQLSAKCRGPVAVKGIARAVTVYSVTDLRRQSPSPAKVRLLSGKHV